MATRSLTKRNRGAASGGKDVIVKWTGLLTGDDGQWYSEPGAVLRSYSVWGTFGASGGVKFMMTGGDATDPANPVVGAQPDETQYSSTVTSASTTANGAYTAAPSYRPVVNSGDGTTNLNVVMYFVQD